MKAKYFVSICATSTVLLLAGCAGSSDGLLGEKLAITTSQFSSNKVETDLALWLVGSIESPVVGGATLQANDIKIVGEKAYVGYNVAGTTQTGAVQILSVSNASSSSVVSQLTFGDTDVNGLAVTNDALYTVGASSGTTGPAVISRFGFINGVPQSSPSATVALPSYAGTSVSASNAGLFALSGDGGGLNILDPSNLSIASTVSVTDARAVDLSRARDKVFVFSGQPGRLARYSLAGTAEATFNVGGANTPESKSTLQVGNASAVVSLGEAGAKVICLQDGGTLSSIGAVSVSGLSADRTVTNAAAAAHGLLFTANGEAGVYVYAFKKNSFNTGSCRSTELTQIGAINFGSSISSNFVYVKGDLLFVAAGLGGVKVVRIHATGKTDDNDDFDE